MKKLLLLGMIFCLSVAASAQKVYFLYLQTDDQAPFYVRLSDKIYSSAASGFLILPNLTDSTYSFNLGYAKSTQPENKFAVTINQSDKGYLIKNFADGPGLFDLQDLSIVKATVANKDTTEYQTRLDKFSSILSKAADDPGLLKVPVTKKEEVFVKPEEKAVVKTEELKKEENKEQAIIEVVDSVKATQTEEAKKQSVEENKIDTVATVQIEKKIEETVQPNKEDERSTSTEEVVDYRRSVISRYAESSTTEGFGVIYFDKYEGKTDTIRILIPPSKFNLTSPESETVIKSETRVEDNSILKASDQKEGLLISEGEQKKKSDISSSCQDIASDKDFMKLRKNMAGEDNDDDMIDEARKAFKNKCYSVEQVRYLSSLFLTSSAKYRFFDLAYLHVSDNQNFNLLQSEIKDEYYLKRFKALIGE